MHTALSYNQHISALVALITDVSKTKLQDKQTKKQFLPSFYFREVKSHLSIGNCLFIQIPAIPPDKC